MLTYFPVAYSDELIYSMIARYARHTGQSDNQKSVIRDVFGSETAAAIPDLPSHLSSFQQKLGWIWRTSVSELIKNHTLGFFYLPFLDHHQVISILESMASDYGGSIHTRSGIAASSIRQPLRFRYCPQCLMWQMTELGEPYWQRSHQLPGIDVCFQHSIRLIETTLPFHPKAKHLFRSAQDECSFLYSPMFELATIDYRLNRLIQGLSQCDVDSGFSRDQWSLFYQYLAGIIGLKKGSRVDHEGICELITKDWSSSELEIVKLLLSSQDWMIQLFRKHRRSFHPLHHLVVWSSLLSGLDVKQIFSLVGKIQTPSYEKKSEKAAHRSFDRPTRSHYRRLWISALGGNQGLGVKELRSKNPGRAAYAWLYRNDRDWLMAHRPQRAAISHHFSTDYCTWDKQVLDSLQAVYKEKKPISERQRLSRTYLINRLPRSTSIAKHIKDLPRSKEWLDRNAESIEDYQLHRIYATVRSLKADKLPIKRWRILKGAGIRFNSVPWSIEQAIHRLECSTQNIR